MWSSIFIVTSASLPKESTLPQYGAKLFFSFFLITVEFSFNSFFFLTLQKLEKNNSKQLVENLKQLQNLTILKRNLRIRVKIYAFSDFDIGFG